MKHKKLPEKLQAWVDVRKKYHLSHMHIQMARELGLNPKKFSGLANAKQESWKEPLPVYIQTLYHKQISKIPPADVKSREQLFLAQQQKKQQKKEAKVITERLCSKDSAPMTPDEIVMNIHADQSSQ